MNLSHVHLKRNNLKYIQILRNEISISNLMDIIWVNESNVYFMTDHFILMLTLDIFYNDRDVGRMFRV